MSQEEKGVGVWSQENESWKSNLTNLLTVYESPYNSSLGPFSEKLQASWATL